VSAGLKRKHGSRIDVAHPRIRGASDQGGHRALIVKKLDGGTHQIVQLQARIDETRRRCN
jgi:hypothetical protein